MSAGAAVRRRTLVSFHAHPDDEALLTGGTLAKAAAAGHRVVLVTATGGGEGLAAARLGSGDELARRRVEELHRAAAALGVESVRLLGYADSGMDGKAPGDTFVRADPEAAAARLAAVLRSLDADVLTTYDAAGGYGHPDHVKVHAVGRLAATMAGTPVVLEATIDRDLLRRALRMMRLCGAGRRLPVLPLAEAYTPRAQLTHRVDVRAQAGAKHAAMRAHVSQATADAGDDADRTLAFLLRLPAPVFRAVLGREWFVQVGLSPAGRLLDDIFACGGREGRPA
jgi:LmbE family N-acetylglucosaminyl deacetylase